MRPAALPALLLLAPLALGGGPADAPVGGPQAVRLAKPDGAYHAFVPPDWDRAHSLPAVVALHPANSSSEKEAAAWVEAAKARGWMVIAPQSRGLRWLDADGDLVLAAIEDARARWRVDPDRVVLAGCGSGGLMATRWGLPNFPRFAGIFAHGGVQLPEDLKPGAGKIPVLLSCGEKDDFLTESRKAELALQGAGYDAAFVPWPGVGEAATPPEVYARALGFHEDRLARPAARLSRLRRARREKRWPDAARECTALLGPGVDRKYALEAQSEKKAIEFAGLDLLRKALGRLKREPDAVRKELDLLARAFAGFDPGARAAQALAGLAGGGPPPEVPPAAPAEAPSDLELIPIVEAPGGAFQPSVAVDGKGTVHCAFVAGGRVSVASLAPDAASFAGHDVAAAPDVSCGMRRGPRAVAVEGAVVVSWIESRWNAAERKVVGSGDLLASRSADGGATWTAPAPVNTRRGGAEEGLHAMAAGAGKTVYAAWLQPLREGKRGTGVRCARSDDAGATWPAETEAYDPPSGSICECCHPSLAVSPDGIVAVLFRNSLEGCRDLWVALSPDRAKSFGPAHRLGKGAWKIEACPMDGGGVAFGPGGAILTAWRRELSVFAASPGTDEALLGAGVQPWVGGVPGGATFATWTDPAGDLLWTELSAATPAIHRVPAGGERFSCPVVAGSASGVVFAAWERLGADPAKTRVEGAFLSGGTPK